MDSACSDKSAIASRVLQLHTPSMRPCTRLQNANFSSTILESFGCLLTFLAFPKVDSSSTILQSHIAPQIQLECEKLAQLLESSFSPQTDSPFLSSRDFRKEVVAIHNKKADSSVKMDCHAIATALARNDRVGRVDCRADFQSARNDRENNSASKKVDSSKNAAILNELAQDSRIFAHNVQSAFDTKAAGGRIFDEKVGLRRLLRGDKT